MTVVTKPLVLNETVDTTNEVLSSIAESMATLAQDKDASYLLAQSAQAVATEAKEIAKGAQYAEVFETEALMFSWISNAENKNKLKRGDNLYIKALDVPDYWVTDVLTTADEDGNYYKIARLATDKVNLENVATTDSEVTTNPDYLVVTAEIGGKQVSMRMAKSEAIKMFNFGHSTIADLASGVAQEMGNPIGYKSTLQSGTNIDTVLDNGIYFSYHSNFSGTVPIVSSYNSSITVYKTASSTIQHITYETGASFIRYKSYNNDWGKWQRIDNFGANTEAELASVVAEKLPGNNMQKALYDSIKLNDPEHMINSGVYRIAGSAGSLGTTYGTVFVARNTTYGFQIFISQDTARVKIRGFNLGNTGATEIESSIPWVTIV